MTRIFTLFAFAILFSFNAFSQCNPAVPSGAIVVSNTQTVSGTIKSYWICKGDTLTHTSGGICKFYLESGATLINNGGDICTAYAPAGAKVNFIAGNSTTIYFVDSADVLGKGGAGSTLTKCPSIGYDYTNAPANGCPVCLSAGTRPTGINSSSGTAFCPGSTLTLTQVGGTLAGNGQWKWYTGSCGGTLVDSGASITVTPTAATTYYVRAEDSCNTSCAQITVTPSVVSAPVIQGNPSSLCTGHSTTLSITNNSCTGNCSYSWSDGSTGTSIVVNPTSATTYTATVKNDCGDSASSSVTFQTCGAGIWSYGSAYGAEISPNPSNGTFVLSMPSAPARPDIRIFDVVGNSVPFTAHENAAGYARNEISIGDKPAGIYFVQVTVQGNTFVLKLITNNR